MKLLSKGEQIIHVGTFKYLSRPCYNKSYVLGFNENTRYLISEDGESGAVDERNFFSWETIARISFLTHNIFLWKLRALYEPTGKLNVAYSFRRR